jgi:hypothetical protein
MSEHSSSPVHWFEPTGRVTGYAMLALWVVAAVIGIISGADLAFEGVMLLGAVATHATVLRPRLGTTEQDLHFRGMFSDLTVPLTMVKEVRVDRYFEAKCEGTRFISPSVGRSRRKALSSDQRDPMSVYADMVEDVVRARISDATALLRPGGSPREIRRTWARFEIAAAIAAVALFVIFLVV